jgi:hypothetical protein
MMPVIKLLSNLGIADQRGLMLLCIWAALPARASF